MCGVWGVGGVGCAEARTKAAAWERKRRRVLRSCLHPRTRWHVCNITAGAAAENDAGGLLGSCAAVFPRRAACRTAARGRDRTIESLGRYP